MAPFHPNNLLTSIKADSVRVHAPSQVVFLCGGAIDNSLETPVMLRDAFHRAAVALGVPYSIVLAEAAEPLTTDAGYKDLFSFESDIAQIVGLILLFAESAGSLAELGAFAAIDTIAPNLLAVLDEYYYNQVSFIRNGPVKFLEHRYGDEWVHVLDRLEVGIDENGGIAGINNTNFSASIMPAVQTRLDSRPNWTKLNNNVAGHAILLMVGLCREFGALTQSEIKKYLAHFGFIDIRFDNFFYCANLLGWLGKVRKGNHIFYVATGGTSAIDYHIVDTAPFREKLRWRHDIRAFWKANDTPRFNAIVQLTPMPTL